MKIEDLDYKEELVQKKETGPYRNAGVWLGVSGEVRGGAGTPDLCFCTDATEQPPWTPEVILPESFNISILKHFDNPVIDTLVGGS